MIAPTSSSRGSFHTAARGAPLSPCVGRAAPVARGNIADRDQQNGRHDHRDDDQVPDHREHRRREQHADHRPDDGSKTEEPMHERHHGPADGSLHVCALDVHRDLGAAHAEPEQPQTERDDRSASEPCSPADHGDTDRDAGDARADDRAGPPPRDERSRAEDPDHRADRQTEEDQPHLCGRRLDQVTHIGRAGDPGRDPETRQEEREEERISALESGG